MNRIEVKAEGKGRASIRIYGRIGEGFFEKGNTPDTVRDDLEGLGDIDSIDVYVNSPGGNVWDGIGIANILASHAAKVHAHVEGLAASAASVITSAADEVTMGQGTQIMIHSPRALFAGTADEMRDFADVLDEVEEGMIDFYEMRCGKDRDEIRDMVRAETWMSAKKAVDEGFADNVAESKSKGKPQASWQPILACFEHTPESFKAPQAPAGNQPPANAGHPNGDNPMKDENAKAVEAAAKEARNAERKRVTDITALCSTHEMDSEFLEKAIAEDMTVEKVTALILDSKVDETQGGTPGHAEVTEDEHDKFIEGASDWLVARSGRGTVKADNPFRGMTIENIARETMALNGISTRGMNRVAVIKAAITHSTSDFPNIFENALHKTMVGAFEKAKPTWPRIARVGTLTDYRPHLRYHAGSFSDLLEVQENGEYKDGTIGDAEKEQIQAIRKGRILNLSREMLINDDMSVFTNLAVFFGQAAARTVDKDVYALFALNGGNGPTMGDGTALFDAAHGNIAASGAAPSMAGFEAMRVQMAEQTDPSGNDFLDIRPNVWLGPLALGGQARQVNEAEYDDEATKNQRKPNISRGMVSDIVDTPRLTGTPWYLLADPDVEPVIEVGFLDGVQVPQLEMEEAFRTDGVAWRVRYEYGVAAVGWRGVVKNAGQ